MILTILSTGFYLTLRANFLQLRVFGRMLHETVFSSFSPGRGKKGEISPFQALTTALAATIGTGNIAGVATAITLGGPGAIFWMWVSAFFGMMTKYGEVVLAVYFRRAREEDTVAGGPMYYLEYGLRSRGLAIIYAALGSLAAFGIGNMVQANSLADAAFQTFGVPAYITGVLLSLAVGAVILGGLKRVASVTSRLVPFMALFYFAGTLAILLRHAGELPAAFLLILRSAFTGQAALGGFAGAGFIHALRFGVARGVFTNEAGLGSASIAHAAARTDHPARQGLWGMFEVFFDTHVVCTMTALCLLVTGAWTTAREGAAMTMAAFNIGLPGPGELIVMLGLVFFSFSTLVAWAFYGEKCLEYLVGTRLSRLYRYLWIPLIPAGAVGGLRFVWALADTLNGLMAVPNLLGLFGLSAVIMKLTADFFNPGRGFR